MAEKATKRKTSAISIFCTVCPSDAAEGDGFDAVVGTFAQDQAGALGVEDVLLQVLQVDRAPDLERLRARLVGGELGVAVEVGGGIAERGGAQAEEACDEPRPNGWLGVDVDREIEEVGNERDRFAVSRSAPASAR